MPPEYLLSGFDNHEGHANGSCVDVVPLRVTRCFLAVNSGTRSIPIPRVDIEACIQKVVFCFTMLQQFPAANLTLVQDSPSRERQ